MNKTISLEKLKRGYTTGVHTSFAFKSALQNFIATKKLSISITNKMDNDDLDVTKGCQIVVSISDNLNDLELNSINHQPHIIYSNNTQLKLYAGVGVGVVTKDGLKPPKNHPAINPKPLDVITKIFNTTYYDNKILYCTVSVTNGETIAKQTANSKVGVLGGISILGTTGFVKPISATAYINSIKQELNYAKANHYDKIIFTLGNTAFKQSQNLDNNIYVIDIGNFIYDGIYLAVKRQFADIELWLGIGKCVKIAQGFKNTHNRFGGIDFQLIADVVDIDIKDCLTIKRVRQLLMHRCNEFDNNMINQAKDQCNSWFNQDIEIKIVE